MSSMHEDVKFKFISFFCVTAQKLDMEKRYIKTLIKAFVMNQILRCLEGSQCRLSYQLRVG
jgi:hypothetical protein